MQNEIWLIRRLSQSFVSLTPLSYNLLFLVRITNYLLSPPPFAFLGSAEKALLEQYGVPLTGTETRHYTNHALSYDQSKRVPRWVLEHISKSKIMGRWLEVKALMKGTSKFRTRRIIDSTFFTLQHI